MRCVDVAALFAAAILRRNPDSVVVPFDTRAYQAKDRSKRFDPKPVGTTVEVRRRWNGLFVAIGRGQQALRKDRAFAGIVLVSDNESWINSGRAYGYGRGGSTGVMTEWEKFKKTQARTRHRRSEVGLHRHRPIRQHASTRA